MFRTLRTAALIVTAVGVPYYASSTQWGRGALDSLSASTGLDGASSVAFDEGGLFGEGGNDYANHAHYEVEKLRQGDLSNYRYDEAMARKLGALPQDPNAAPKLAVMRVDDLRQVLRFDIGPDWVINRFARVSTVLADLSLEGLRVPLVTGTRPDDIAGTLTYYFDGNGKLQRVTIHGFTGDPRKLTETMTSSYGLQREPSLEAGVFTKRWNGRPVHFLRLTHAPVVYSDAVHQKFTMFLELNQPNLAFGISPEAQRIVDSDRKTSRW